MNVYQELAQEIAKRALREGLRVWLANKGEGTYGFFTGDGSRIVVFEARRLASGPRFIGKYKSTGNGTGWVILKEYGASSRYEEIREINEAGVFFVVNE